MSTLKRLALISGGPAGGGRDAASGSGLLELLKNLLVTGLIVAAVAGLSVGIDKLSARALRSLRS